MSDDLDTFSVVHAFCRYTLLVHNHISSFGNFVINTIPEIITESPIGKHDTSAYKFEAKFVDVFIDKPYITEHDGTVTKLFPAECRMRDLSYSAPVFVVVQKSLYNKMLKKAYESEEKVYVGMLPIMVNSIQCRLYNATIQERIKAKECELDPGGYFIIHGNEKALMCMERMATNQVYVFPNKNDPSDIYAEISSIEERSRKAPSQFRIHMVTSSILGRKSIKASCTYFKKEFPVGILLKALGLIDQIKELILEDGLFHINHGIIRKELESIVDSVIEESYHISTVEEAFGYLNSIASTKASTEDKADIYIHAVLQKEFLPHIGIDITSYEKKALFLIYMIQYFLMVYFKQCEYDDHDHIRNKRLDVSGTLLSMIFKQSWSKVVKELDIAITKKLESNLGLHDLAFSQLVNNQHLTKDLSYVLSTGNWTAIISSKIKTGVSQILNRFNFQSFLSHLRRIINPIPKNSVLSRPRMIHNSTWGLIDPWDSPEGSGIGLVKNKAFTTHISIGYSDIFLIELLLLDKLSQSKTKEFPWTIFVNGKIIGYDTDNHKLRLIRKWKLSGVILYDTSVYPIIKLKQIRCYTDSGRMCRPLFIVKHNKIALTNDYVELINSRKKDWYDLLIDGIIEMVDSGEQERLLVCVRPEKLGTDGLNYTHCEISPIVIAGVCSGIIPFANHSPAARLTYQNSMSKQAASIPAINYKYRYDNSMHILNYPQKPLSQTDIMEDIHFNELASGELAVVAMITAGGYNMEDGIMIKKGSIDRGLFRTMFYRTYEDTETKTVGTEERFGIPVDKCTDKLGPDGIVYMNVFVKDGDMLIGKITNAIDQEGHLVKPRHVYVRHGESGIVDSVLLTINPDGTRSVKVRIRCERIPEIGDKLATAPSQKSIISAIVQDENMPFNPFTGMIPDLLINPHSEPSRMTIGRQIDIISAKNAALQGKPVNATIFKKRNMKAVEEGLFNQGFHPKGWETLCDGTTGEMLEVKIYVGICYYQRLKHMVQDKIQCRGAKGPINSLSHQTSDGRAKQGGLRFGEMERDNGISHGSSAILQERLFLISDPYKMPVCDECGLIAIGNPIKKIYICKACKSRKVSIVPIPYATKQLILDMYSVNIGLRLRLE
jgi:DNA-directed RNA polymerase II subunit RPB2